MDLKLLVAHWAASKPTVHNWATAYDVSACEQDAELDRLLRMHRVRALALSKTEQDIIDHCKRRMETNARNDGR